MDNERRDPGNGIQYDEQQKSRNDGGVFSLQSDDYSTASSPTTWKQTPSIKSGSASNDKDKGSVPYKPTTTRVPESPELPAFPTKPASLYQTSESIEEDERGSEYTPRDPTEPPPPRAVRRVIELGPAESGVRFA